MKHHDSSQYLILIIWMLHFHKTSFRFKQDSVSTYITMTRSTIRSTFKSATPIGCRTAWGSWDAILSQWITAHYFRLKEMHEKWIDYYQILFLIPSNVELVFSWENRLEKSIQNYSTQEASSIWVEDFRIDSSFRTRSEKHLYQLWIISLKKNSLTP